MLLTVGILSVPRRLQMMSTLVAELTKQVEGRPVEILCLLDNWVRSIGAKRNAIIQLAQGSFLTFVDDDDWIEPNYIESLLASIQANADADCIVFDVMVHGWGGQPKVCRYGKEYHYSEDVEAFYRLPNHLMCHKTENCRRFPFPDISYWEDTQFSDAIATAIAKQVRIPAALYQYRFSAADSEAMKRRGC